MAIARFKDLSIDTADGETLGRFWAAALGLTFEPGAGADSGGGGGARGDSAKLSGPTPEHTVWMHVVPEDKTGKHRAHLDVHTDSIDTLTELGASVLETREGWTVMRDPEGGEFCAFVREQPPDYRLYELVVDCADAAGTARWWSQVLDASVQHDAEHDVWSIESVPGAPFESMVFVPVRERKQGKNRVHWHVSVAELQPLLDSGATVLRPTGGDVDWSVLADPEGNEFCAFVE